jgi:hypothetical protein
MRRVYLIFLIIVPLVFCYGVFQAQAGDKMAPKAHEGKMMLEHVGMSCQNCHGDKGPVGVKMGNHPEQKCTDCHILEEGKVTDKFKKREKTTIAKENMLEHAGAFACKKCHGEHGAKGMMLEHVGMDCEICHVPGK